jgi:hypothetical protein
MDLASLRYDDALSPEERRLIVQLREVPLGPVRQQLVELLGDLVGFVRDPCCPEAQADGVPCLSLAIACDQCQMVAGTLAALHRRLRRV